MMKMKRVFTGMLAAAAAFSLLGAAPVRAASWEVKTETRYSWTGEKWQKESATSYSFDSRGRRTGSTTKDYTRRWDSRRKRMVTETQTRETSFRYDRKGRTTQHREIENGNEIYRQEYQYSDSKNVVKIYNNRKLTTKRVELKKNGAVTSAKIYGSNGKLTSTVTYYYNDKMDLEKIVEKPVRGKKSVTTITNTYRGGQLRKEVEKSPFHTSVNTYYSTGRICSSRFETDNEVSESRWDSKGRQTYTFFSNDGFSTKCTYKDGREAKRTDIRTDDNGKKTKKTYTFQYKIRSGRVAEQIMYDGETPVDKLVYTYKRV